MTTAGAGPSPSTNIYSVGEDGKVVVLGRSYLPGDGTRPERYLYRPEPVSMHTFVDLIKLVCRVLSDAELEYLEQHCGAVKPPKLLVRNHGRRPRHLIRLYHPDDEAIRFLAGIGNVKLEIVELAIDFCFNDEVDKDIFWKWLNAHLVRPYKRKEDRVEFIDTFRDFKGRRCKRRGGHTWVNVASVHEAPTVYDGFTRKARGVASKLYRDRSSKHSGELFTVHLERTLIGKRAFNRIGLERIGQLSSQDWLRAFWSELQLREPDLEWLGRSLNCHYDGERRHKAVLVGDFNADLARGRAAWAECGGSLQALVDRYRLRVRYGLSRLSTDAIFRSSGHMQFTNMASVSRDGPLLSR